MVNMYSIESLLIGKAYRSSSLVGIIEDAEPYSKASYSNAEAYLVRIRPTNGLSDTYRVIAVSVA
jgi:hypothetical protein